MATSSSLSPAIGEAGDSNAPPTSRSAARSGSVASNKSNTSASDAPQRSPSLSSVNRSTHRQSFADNLRHIPPSPRQRQPSLTQAAIQELLNNPPHANRFHNPKFANREWTDITVGELVSGALWVEMDSTVEEATMQLLSKSQPSVVLIRESKTSKTAISTFDFRDLNAYLVVVVGLAKPAEDQIEASNAIVAKTQRGEPITVREIQPICRTEPLVSLPTSSNLTQAMEILGSGIHRLLVSDPTNGDIIGILSQGHMVEFFWNEGVNFASIDQLYPILLRDLNIGTKEAISVNSDAPLSEALMMMFDEGLTSVAVVDNGHNVVGNISTKDVRHLTNSSSAPLLKQSCMHFISVILNERGVENGQDTFPVFYVSSYSTLAHTVAKLVATRSHRMWVVESSSPSPTAPETPLTGPSSFTQGPPAAPPSPQMAASVPASAMMGARLSGKLSGVVSLTDVLNTFAKSTGLHPSDPRVQRARRRKSSSSSMRPSIDSLGAGPIEGHRQ